MLGEKILQPSVAELIKRPDGTQDTSLFGVMEESQEAHRRMPAPGELNKSKRLSTTACSSRSATPSGRAATRPVRQRLNPALLLVLLISELPFQLFSHGLYPG